MIILLFNRLLIGCVFARAHTHTQFSYILYLHTVNVLYMYRTYYIYIRPASLSLFLMIADRLAVRFSAMNYSVNM